MAERPLSGPMAARVRVEYLVRPARDRGELRRILAPHRLYAAYALGQLQPGLYERSQWWISRGEHGQALVLHSRGGLGNAFLAVGGVESLEALLRVHPGPRHTFLTCQLHHLETVLRHYELPDRQSMLRMGVGPETFRRVEGEARRLRGGDVRQINSLYRSEGTPAFYTAENIDGAAYYGVYDGGRLVSVAGTHVVAAVEAMAVVGNVFTHPAYRGRGLGTLVTSAVTEELLKSCRDIVLSVDPRNEAAVRAYERLGFAEVGRLIEGAAVRRGSGFGPFVRRQIASLRGRRYGAELVSIPS